jgi:predicted transposase YdaD
MIRTLRLVNGKSLREAARMAGVSKMTVTEAFVRELAQRVPQHGDALMTIAQQL